ncbi:MAG: hypothetical protein JXB13_18680 [Phycisphaerae bacterium]|nr:hypothetical protein [Phycisphaerae bacterium]
MKRAWKTSVLLMGLTAVFAAGPVWTAQAAPAAADTYGAIPADAWAVVYVRNAAEVEKKIMDVVRKFDVPPMSALMMAKGFLGFMSGVNDNGDLALVVLPTDDMNAIDQSVALLVPITDYTELTAALQLEPAEEGEGRISKMVNPNLPPIFMAPKGKFAVLAPSVANVKKILDSTTGLQTVLAAHDLERASDDDLTIWANAATVVASPLVSPFITQFEAMGTDTTFFKELQSLQLGIKIAPAGIRLGMGMAFKEGSDMGRAAAMAKTTSDTMLTGLPAENYILAYAGVTTKEAAEFGAGQLNKQIDKILNNPAIPNDKINPEKLRELLDRVAAMIKPMRGLGIEISALPGTEGEGGFVGFTKVVKVEGGAAAMVGQFKDIIAMVTGGLVLDEEVNKVLSKIQYVPAAETIGGVSVDHLVMKLSEIEDIEEEDLETVHKVIGKEGVLFRIGAVDTDHVIATFGGGPGRFDNVIGLVKGKQAPLSKNPGIVNTAKAMATQRNAEMYFAVDSLMRMLSDIGKATDEPFPVTMPQINAPVGMVSYGVGKAAGQADVFVPMELIIQVRDVWKSMTQPAPSPAPASETAPAAEPVQEPEPAMAE